MVTWCRLPVPYVEQERVNDAYCTCYVILCFISSLFVYTSTHGYAESCCVHYFASLMEDDQQVERSLKTFVALVSSHHNMITNKSK